MLRHNPRLRVFMHNCVHVVLTLVMLWIAFTFLDEKDSFTGSTGFSVMGRWAEEKTWGLICFGVGIIGVASTPTTNWKIRVLAASVLSIAHMGIAVLYFMGNSHGTGAGLFGGYAILGAALAYSTAHLGSRISTSVEPPNFS